MTGKVFIYQNILKVLVFSPLQADHSITPNDQYGCYIYFETIFGFLYLLPVRLILPPKTIFKSSRNTISE